MRIAPPIVIDETTRKELERLSRKRSMASRVVLRSRIVLLAVDGMQNKQIAERLGVSTRMAALWRGRARMGTLTALPCWRASVATEIYCAN